MPFCHDHSFKKPKNAGLGLMDIVKLAKFMKMSWKSVGASDQVSRV